MADVAESIVPPPALDQKGNTTIWFVPTIADVTAPKAATEIGAVGSFRLTYSFTPGGFNLAGSQSTTKDERLGLPQPLESMDTNEVTLDLEYVESTAAGSANVVLAPVAPATTKSGYFVIRTDSPNSLLAAASQKVRVIPVTLGAQNLGTPAGTGKWTVKQKAAITGVVGPAVALAA